MHVQYGVNLVNFKQASMFVSLTIIHPALIRSFFFRTVIKFNPRTNQDCMLFADMKPNSNTPWKLPVATLPFSTLYVSTPYCTSESLNRPVGVESTDLGDFPSANQIRHLFFFRHFGLSNSKKSYRKSCLEIIRWVDFTFFRLS